MDETKEIKTTEEKPVKKKSLIKKLFKIILYIILGLIGLNVLLFVLLSIPSVQQKVADFAVGELKKTLNTEVTIEEVRLSLFNRATLKGIYIEDQSQDTLLFARSIDVHLSPWQFIKNNKLAITSITAEDFLLNINQKDSDSDFNFQFVIDAFASNDTTIVDTTKSSLIVIIEDVNLKNGRLNYDILSDTVTPGIFNASHISVYDLNANVDLNSIDTEKLNIAINSLKAHERTGLEITSLKGHLYSEKDRLWTEGLSLTLPSSHMVVDKVAYNLKTDEFELETNDTEITPADLVAIMPELKFLRHNITLNTHINGTLPAVIVNNINLSYGEDFYLRGNANIADYGNYGSSQIALTIDKMKASQTAISDFARLGDSTFVTPEILRDMGDIFLTGKVTGQLDRFRLDAEAWCRQGAVNMVATGNVDTTFTHFNVTAGLQTQNFNLGNLIGQDSIINRLTAHVDLKASQNGEGTLSAVAKGRIDALNFTGKETMKNLPFEAYYNSKEMGLSANADWKIGKIQAVAVMSQAAVPDIHVDLKVDTLHVDYFYKNENWINPRLSLDLNADIKGLDIDKTTGVATIDSLHFYGANFDFNPGKFTLEAGKDSINNKYININSSLLTANIKGQYAFLTLAEEMEHVLSGYLPDVFPHEHSRHSKADQNNFTFNITATNTEELGKIFALPVDIIQPASIGGQINTIDKQIKIDGNIPFVRYGQYDIKNTTINISNVDSAFNIVAASRVLMNNGEINLSLLTDGANNTIHTVLNVASISADTTDININGKIEARGEFSRNQQNELVSLLKISPTNVNIGKLALRVLPAQIQNEGERTRIENFGLGLNRQRFFGVDGAISHSKSDTLRAYFDRAEIGDILEAFDVKNIHARLNGNILLTNLLDQTELYTKGFEMADIILFGDSLGTLNLESEWSEEYGGARLNATLVNKGETHAEIDGTVYTIQDSLDIQLMLNEMPLRWIQPFVSDMLNKVDGTISSNLLIEGSMKAPKTRGFLGFNNTQIGVDYTNVVYTISDTIRISPDRIGFDNLKLRDPDGNTANVSATLTHQNFQNMKYNLNMQMDKVMVLNTESRTDSLFYGKVYASGNAKIDGDDNGINITMQVRNDKNSRLNILLPQHSEASDYKSVVYINVPEEKLRAEQEAASPVVEDALPIKLNVKLDVNPDILLGVIIDPATGDEMQARGTGSINFTYDLQTENMAAYGDYTLSEGFVKLNLQNIKKLQFQIQDGGKLKFIGDPMKTQFDITAFRRVKADLKTLDSSGFETYGNTKVNVDCILDISGNIDKMEVSYDISLPDAPDDIKTRVNTYISTDEQKTLQFASLVATGSFYSNLGTSGANFGNSLWTNIVSSTLSGAITNLVGNALGNKWTIGANIEANDGSFSDLDMSVNVSRKFLDDKLKFNTNLGYRTDQTTASENSFIGDFDLEYELNSIWTLKAYSHTNDRYYRQAPTTQGIGIVYSKEAATLKRLFQSFKPRRRNRNRDGQLQRDSINTVQGDSISSDIRRTRSSQREEKKSDSLPSDSTQTTIVRQPAIINEENENKEN